MGSRPKSATLPVSTYPWWKIFGLPLALFTPLSILLVIIPPTGESPWVGFAVGIVFIGMVPLIVARLWDAWWAAYALAGVLSAELLLIAIRIWLLLLPPNPNWLAPLVLLYVVAWAIPLVMPKLSAVLWREQTAPKTTLGRGCLGIALGIGGAAGGIGAVFSFYAPVAGGIPIGLVVIAVGASLLVITISHVLAHQIVAQRPPPGYSKLLEGLDDT